MKINITLFLITLFFFGAFSAHSQIQVLTGTEHGTYYKQAMDMNALLPMQKKVNGTDSLDVAFLDVRKTAGSAFNFDKLADAKHPVKVAFMQVDVLLLKRMEDMLHETNMTKDLVILMPLSVEEIHLISKEENHINSIKSLEGQTVGIGTSNEGTYSTALYIQNASKISWNNKNLNSQDAMKALLLDKIDAYFLVGAAPMQMLNISPAASPMKMHLAALENLNGWADYYIPITMPANTYPWLKADVTTFGVTSVVVVNKSKLTEKDIEDLKMWKAVTLENLEKLKTDGHPSWKTATNEAWDETVWPIMK